MAFLNFRERREIAAKFDIFPEDGYVTVFSHGFHGAPWRSYGVLVGDCLRSHGSSTACMELSSRALRVQGALTVLTAFCLHSEVVEITGRVLISQVIHEPMLPVSDNASTVSLCPGILEPSGYYALVSSSILHL